MELTKIAGVILAAGQGTRMKSDIPKVLHPLAGKPLLGHVVDCARALQPTSIVIVYGHGGERVRAAFADQTDLGWAEQPQQLGTGHAVQQALPLLPGVDQILVLYGDVPLTQTDTLESLIAGAGLGVGLLALSLGTLRIQRGPGRAIAAQQLRIGPWPDILTARQGQAGKAFGRVVASLVRITDGEVSHVHLPGTPGRITVRFAGTQTDAKQGRGNFIPDRWVVGPLGEKVLVIR